MITLVNLLGFLIQMIICPLVMLPWLLIRLVMVLIPANEERSVVEVYEQLPAPAFG
jgi:hypothetical protein